MATVSKLTRNDAKLDPSAAFESPDSIVNEILMTRGEKIATLQRWRDDVLLQMRATDEGMQTRRTSATNSELLQGIEAALAELVKPELV